MTFRKNTRWKLLLLFLLFAAPILLAFLFYFNAEKLPFKTMNYGSFLEEPFAWQDLNLYQAVSGNKIVSALPPKHWGILYYEKKHCRRNCINNLYKLRQTRLALGVAQESLELFFVTGSLFDDHATTKTLLANQYRTIQHLFLLGEDSTYLESGHMYIVDPLGKIILFYPTNPNPEKMYKDLKRLVRA